MAKGGFPKFGGGMNMGNMMKQMQKMQRELENTQKMLDEQDWIMTAINEANRKAQEKHDSEINKITGGINIPGL